MINKYVKCLKHGKYIGATMSENNILKTYLLTINKKKKNQRVSTLNIIIFRIEDMIKCHKSDEK